MKILFLLLILFLTACSTTGTVTTTPPAPKYEMLLTGTVDGNAINGTGLGTNASSHSMTIQSAIAVNYFTMDSCHRSIQFTDVIKVPWYDWSGDNKSFSWTYAMAPTIEDNGNCILRFCAFSKTVGSPPVSCAVVDFKNAKFQLPGTNICNGAAGATTGTAMCQSKVGLIERYQFGGPVVIAPQVIDPTGKTAPYWIATQCVGKFIDTNQSLFEYTVPTNECTIEFMEKVPPFRRAKLTVFPYDTAIYPGGS